MIALNSNNKKTIIQNGKIILFDYDRFKEEICKGECCFICGAKPEIKKFNNEHIIPNWLLKKFRLHSRKITLPNLSEFTYGRYKIPCCSECNSLMGSIFEQPIQQLISRGFDAIIKFMNEGGFMYIYIWMALIFIKTHLKDTLIRDITDQREIDKKVADSYEWKEIYSTYCIARSFYANITLSENVFGSFIVAPTKVMHGIENFDFCDILDGQGMLIRIDDICFIAIFNDSCVALSKFLPTFNKLGLLTPIQYREILAHLVTWNIHLRDRPFFFLSTDGNENIITAKVPKNVSFRENFQRTFGNTFYYLLSKILSSMNNENMEDIIEQIKSGTYTYLLDNNRNFNTNSMIENKDLI